jgi:Polyketide cyclase / dehydrase and lipid transport
VRRRLFAWRGRTVRILLALSGLWIAAIAQGAEWERVHTAGDLTIDARERPGSAVKEVRAEGVIEAPPHVVRAVVADAERYPEFMPYVKESRVLGRQTAGVLVYQRLSFGVLRLLGLSDRDYILRIAERISPAPDGRVTYKRVWTAVEGPGPPPQPSVVRLVMNRGFWELRPADGGNAHTAALYCIFTDPGGSLPAWVINEANTSAVPRVFAAVRTTVGDPRYAGQAAPIASETGAPDPSIDAGLCE